MYHYVELSDSIQQYKRVDKQTYDSSRQSFVALIAFVYCETYCITKPIQALEGPFYRLHLYFS